MPDIVALKARLIALVTFPGFPCAAVFPIPCVAIASSAAVLTKQRREFDSEIIRARGDFGGSNAVVDDHRVDRGRDIFADLLPHHPPTAC